jgi:RNA polymerase sigma-70 factor, ECF subfamily
MGDATRTQPARSRPNITTDAVNAPRPMSGPTAAARPDFDDLYDRHLSEMYGYCLRRLGNAQAAEDAASLIFHKALESLPGFRGGSARAWLFGIAHHVIADRFRERAADRPLDEALCVPDPAPSPEDLALAGDEGRMVRALLVHLSPDQRGVIELRLAGLTSAEIGQALGRTPGWVDVAQFRALARLRAVIAPGKEERDGAF